MSIETSAMVDLKFLASWSYRAATRRQSFKREEARSMMLHPFVGILIERMEPLTRRVLLDDRDRAAFNQQSAKRVTVVGCVGEKCRRRWQ